jgi:etoposide-induced 2.4 mRNA
MGYAAEAGQCFWSGLRDSVRVGGGGLSLLWLRSFQMMALHNGVLFLGSYVLFMGLLIPGLEAELRAAQPGVLTSLLGLVFFAPYATILMLWFVPLYVYTVYANALWHSGIAAELIMQRKPKKGDTASAVTAVTDFFYKVVVHNVMLVFAFLSGYLPFYIGPIVQAVLYAWLYAVYCFEYKWQSKGFVEYFETRWVYFVGFGAPLTAVSYLLPSFFSAYPIVSILVPFFCLSAQHGRPTPQLFIPRLRLRQLSEAASLAPLISKISEKRAVRSLMRSSQDIPRNK